jgi:hypothetical protein
MMLYWMIWSRIKGQGWMPFYLKKKILGYNMREIGVKLSLSFDRSDKLRFNRFVNEPFTDFCIEGAADLKEAERRARVGFGPGLRTGVQPGYWAQQKEAH